jgi:hypothetical protein
MAKVPERKPKTFTEFVGLIEEIQSKVSGPVWYRGCGRADHLLLPSLYRHKTKTKVDELSRLEADLMTRFRQRSIPFHNRPLNDDWDALFFMQHYGAPTRLLDWTENPMIALYFAVMSASFTASKAGKLTFKSDVAVWILNPISWNRKSLSHQTFDGGVLTPGDDALKGYRPSPSFTGMFNHPVALYGSHNSSRIVAQRGVFTIFGQNTEAMEGVYNTQSFPHECLVKAIIKKDVLQAFRSSILNHGMTESVVYPDLEGLAREIRRTFGFEF